MIRQANCQNDHPTYVNFLQLYKILSIYKLIKPPSFGNCTITEQEQTSLITVNDLKLIWKEDDEPTRKYYINKLKTKLDGLIIREDWDIDNVFSEHDYCGSEVIECVVYYVTGYLCRKLLKLFHNCEICKKSLALPNDVGTVDRSVALLTNIKTKGYLIHPNINFYKLISHTEEYFSNHITNSADIYNDTTEYILENYNFSYPCEEHKYDVMACTLHNYLLLRMRQYCKQEDSKRFQQSKEKKKLSRLEKH